LGFGKSAATPTPLIPGPKIALHDGVLEELSWLNNPLYPPHRLLLLRALLGFKGHDGFS